MSTVPGKDGWKVRREGGREKDGEKIRMYACTRAFIMFTIGH